MKYRPITDLSDEEIKEACSFNDIEENKILDIKRYPEAIPEQVNILVKNYFGDFWTAIRDPFDSCHYFEDKKKRYQYYQWCLAKGVCCWLKDNPYLEAENEKAK